MKIEIKPSPTADTRTCDWSKVTKDELLRSSQMHKQDIAKAIGVFQSMLTQSATLHDHDKLHAIDHFHRDFKTGFKETGWWDNHRKINRHHLTMEDGIPEDVNLIDVLDYIADCVMAGMARSGSVYDITLPAELLSRAFANTVNTLKASVTVARAEPPKPEAEPGGGEQ